MSRPILSVIVPIYNSEKYLRQCLKSIQDQTFDDLEVICINDGSTDGSRNIIEEFVKEDKRFKIVDQSNQGINKTRAVGYKKAQGKYVACVDNDDFLELNTYERMVEEAEKHNSDIVICNYSFFPKRIKNKDLWYRSFKGNNDWSFIAKNTVPWNKIIKKELLDKLNICKLFEKIGENAYSIILASTNNISTIDDALYNYRVGHVSVSTNYKNIDWFRQAVKHNEEKHKMSKELGINKDTQQFFFYCYLYYNLILMTVAARNGDKKIYTEAKKIVKKNSLFSRKYKAFYENHVPLFKRIFLRCFIYPNYSVAKNVTKIVMR